MWWLALCCACLLGTVSICASLEDGREIPKPGGLMQSRSKAIFARRGVMEQQKQQAVMSVKAKAVPVVRRCARVMESCVPHSSCCDPCASCHCRFFSAICFCRKLNSSCRTRT